MPDVVGFLVVVVYYHDVTCHGIAGVHSEGLALITVNIGLSQAAYGVGYEFILPVSKLKIEAVDKVGFVYGP